MNVFESICECFASDVTSVLGHMEGLRLVSAQTLTYLSSVQWHNHVVLPGTVLREVDKTSHPHESSLGCVYIGGV